MRLALALALAALSLAAPACRHLDPATQLQGSARPNAPTLPESWTLESPEDFETHRAEALAAMDWLLRTVPQDADPKQWTRARDLALDWIEGQEQSEPRYRVTAAVAMPAINDHRYSYSRYMRMAYQCAKALQVEDQPEASPLDDELAAVEGMLSLYATLLQAESSEPGRSPKLERYWRKREKGKLEAYLAKRMAKG